MRIGINTRFLLPEKMEGFGWYTYEIVKRLVEKHPEHEFVFFFDRPYDKKFIFGDNVTPVVLRPAARHPLLFVLWFEVVLKRALKKHRIDVFYSPDGYLSLSSDIPQVATIHDLNFEHNPEDLPWSNQKYYRTYFPKFAKKADHIIAVSEYTKHDLVKTYKIKPSKITTIWNGASELFQAITIDEQEKIREKYTKGEPYYLFVGAIHPRKNIGRLIEAFELFKKKTGSRFKLLIVGESLWKKKGSSRDLNLLDLDQDIKKEVLFTGHLPLKELARIMASAHALTYVSYFEGFGIPLVEAMRCGVPIIAGDRTSLPEVAGEAAVYCDPFKVEEIAEKMELLYKDTLIHVKLAEFSKKRSELFSWDKAADEVWDILEQTGKKGK